MCIGVDPESGSTSNQACLVSFKSHKLGRVSHSSFDGECIECVDTVDSALGLAQLLEEAEWGPRPGLWDRRQARTNKEDLGWEGYEDTCTVMTEVWTDCQSLISRVYSDCMDQSMSKRRKTDVADIKDCVARSVLRLRKISGTCNPSDPLTKHATRCLKTFKILCRCMGGEWDPDLWEREEKEQAVQSQTVRVGWKKDGWW